MSESLVNFVNKENIKPGYRSDHSLIELNLKFSEEHVKLKTFWKFNNSLLLYPEFVKEVHNTLLNIKREYAAFPYNRDNIDQIDNENFETIINKQLFLEMLLLEIRGKSISFSVALKKKKEKRKSI